MKPLAPKGGNDNVMTPDYIAQRISDHFRPSGVICEPCYGRGAFLRAFPRDAQIRGFEIEREYRACLPLWLVPVQPALDFLSYTCEGKAFDWIVTNPPWSKFRAFLLQSMKVADNIVFLCLVNSWFMRARQEDIQRTGFGLVEILEIKQPPKPWPQTGFMLGAGWLRRGWTGSTTITRENP